MNRTDRNKLKMAMSTFYNAYQYYSARFSSVLDSLEEAEQEKYDNLPSSIQESSKGQDIQDALESLSDLSNLLEACDNEVESLIEGVDFPIAAFNLSSLEFKKTKEERVSFHAKLPVSLLKELKLRASLLGTDMNSLLITSLENRSEKR